MASFQSVTIGIELEFLAPVLEKDGSSLTYAEIMTILVDTVNSYEGVKDEDKIIVPTEPTDPKAYDHTRWNIKPEKDGLNFQDPGYLLVEITSRVYHLRRTASGIDESDIDELRTSIASVLTAIKTYISPTGEPIQDTIRAGLHVHFGLLRKDKFESSFTLDQLKRICIVMTRLECES